MIRILAAVTFALVMAFPPVAPAQTNPGAPGAAPAQTNPAAPGAPSVAPAPTNAAPPTPTNAAPAAPTNPGVAPAQTNAAPPPSPQSQQLLNAGQLDALVAPIALYPDTLIAVVLMASTYPLEVVEAARWAAAHKGLKGAQLKAEVMKQSWDESVKSLTATPSVLQMMSDKLEWTQKLGDAVLAQQPDVMDAIQRLRQRAKANNKLASNKRQTVTTRQQGGQPIIDIEPAEPDMLYVPYYDPSVVYGPWPDADYPPYYFGAPDYLGADLLAAGLAFGAGYALGNWVSGGYRWGGGFNWGAGAIYANRTVNINNANLRNWTHNPIHRQGVRYNNPAVAQKFAPGRNIGAGPQSRMDFRGRAGQPALQPGGVQRPSVGAGAGGRRANVVNRPNVAVRPTVGHRPAQTYRPAGVNRETFNRPAAGFNRPSAFHGAPGFPRPAPSFVHPPGGNAFGNIISGNRAMLDSNRGFSSLGGAGLRPGGFGGGGFGGGGFHGGGFGGGGFHGGGGGFRR